MVATEHTALCSEGHRLFARRRCALAIPLRPPKDGHLQFGHAFPGAVARAHAPFVPTAYDDGRTQLLLCLHGLLPISYRGAAYNIPIAVWLAREYPRLPPIAYVAPTSDMLVRPSKYMDVSGRCQIEYILNWERKSEVRLSLHNVSGTLTPVIARPW